MSFKESNQPMCSMCACHDLNNKAEALCLDCGENLCSRCNIYHRTSTEHLTFDQTSVFNGSELLYTCGTHGRTQLDHVCRAHDEVLCIKCMKAKHRWCRVDYCSLVSEEHFTIKNEIDLLDIETRGTLENLIRIRIQLQSNLKVIEEDADSCRHNCKSFEDNLSERNISNMLDNLKQKETSLQCECNKDLETVSKRITTLEKYRAVLKFTLENCPKKHSYTCMLQIRQKCKNIKEYSLKAIDEMKQTRINVTISESGTGIVQLVDSPISIKKHISQCTRTSYSN